MQEATEQKMQGIRDRIREIIDISELTVSAFALKTKNKQKNIANIVNGNNFPSWEVIFNICVHAPQIRSLENLDIKWLITGRKSETADIVTEPHQQYKLKNQEVDSLKKELQLLKNQLDSKEEVIKLQNELLENYRRQLDMI